MALLGGAGTGCSVDFADVTGLASGVGMLLPGCGSGVGGVAASDG
jgi:hypothetical protein